MKLTLLLPNHLNIEIESIKQTDKTNDLILIYEGKDLFTGFKHHKKTIVFYIAAMRSFHQELVNLGYTTQYIKLDDIGNTHDITSALQTVINTHNVDLIQFSLPGDYTLLTKLKRFSEQSNLECLILEHNLFLSTPVIFKDWLATRKSPIMHHFYIQMRKRYNILLDQDSKPTGGKWSYDAANRSPFKDSDPLPQSSDIISNNVLVQDVVKLVQKHFPDHFGDILPINFCVDRNSALQVLRHFIDTKLNLFGKFQDAIYSRHPTLYHSCIAMYLNASLLTPYECIKAAESAYYAHKVSLESVEGFIRQILGWREYVHGIYWNKMPEYIKANYLTANTPLPDFFWTGHTKMKCVANTVLKTKHFAYAHHIERLMIMSNIATLLQLDPKQVHEWFMIVYIDAIEWATMPNVIGMGLFADGGFLGTKPYVSSGQYINRMSDYCKTCQFNVNLKHGCNACPFNYLYWAFLIKNRAKLNNIQRLKIQYSTLDRMNVDIKNLMLASAQQFMHRIDSGIKF